MALCCEIYRAFVFASARSRGRTSHGASQRPYESTSEGDGHDDELSTATIISPACENLAAESIRKHLSPGLEAGM